MKLDFSFEIEEVTSETMYFVACDGVEIARINMQGVQFASNHSFNMSQLMRITQIAWDEFEKRGVWSYFTIDIEV